MNNIKIKYEIQNYFTSNLRKINIEILTHIPRPAYWMEHVYKIDLLTRKHVYMIYEDIENYTFLRELFNKN